jgi:uncharacterized membrane protein
VFWTQQSVTLIVSRGKAAAWRPLGRGHLSLDDEAGRMSPRRGKKQQPRDAAKPSTRGFGTKPPGRIGLLARLRAYFFAGIIVTAPIGITVLLIWQFITFLDTHVGGLIPAPYNPETYLPFSLPGLGLLIMLAFLTLVGFLAAGLAGRTLVHIGERLLSRMPVVRSVYGTLKQIFETVLAQSSRSFREVVLIEYPRRGIGAMGFVTGPTRGEVQARSGEELVNVFLPTTPNPTSGFLLFVPKSDLVHLNMSIEEGIKLVISGGIVAPKNQLDALSEARGTDGPPEEAAEPKEPVPEEPERLAAR